MENRSPSDGVGCLVRIRSRYPQLTRTERRVADYILSNQDIVRETITQVARASGASYGSLDRFCKRLGYSGFQDLKIGLAEDLGRRRAHQVSNAPGDELEALASAAVRDVHSTLELLRGEGVQRAAQAIAGADFVLIAGLSSSAGTASGIEYRLTRFGIPSACAVDNHMQRHRAATLNPGDVAFLVSFSGSTREILATARIAKKSQATVISLTNHLESPVSELSDVRLVTGIESDPLGAEVASKVAVEFVVTVLFDRVARLLENSRAILVRTFEATADRQL